MSLTSFSDTAPRTDLFANTEGLPGAGAVRATLAREQRRQRAGPAEGRRSLRVRQLLPLCVVAEVYLLALAALCSQGLLPWRALLQLAAAAGVALAGFFLVFVTGLNLKAREKNLTAPIALSVSIILLWTVYVAPAACVILTPFVFMLISYVMHRLAQRAVLLLCASVLCGYAGVIAVQWAQGTGPDNIRMGLLHWMVLALTLPLHVAIAGHVRRLHSALRQAGAKIRNIEERAQRDPLLGCYNRRYLLDALEEQKRLSDEGLGPLCLAVIDLDHFKNINDHVGHLGGDEVLRTFTRIAHENIRQQDLFGRYGGEEFLLILPHTPLLAALNTAERIREQVECNGGQGGRNVTVSIGLTQYIPGEGVLELFARADTAMYLAKRGGRNQVVVEEPNPLAQERRG